MKRGLCFLFAVILLAACGSNDFDRSVPRGFAEWIFNNGKVVTVDKDFSIQQSIAIKDGAIVGVGSNAAMRTWRGPKTREIDLGGRTVIPGLIDAQIHATLAGLTWDGEIHWEQVNSLADGLSQIAAAVKQRPAGSWIVVAGGWVPTQFPERRFPTREELDSIAPQHPVYMQYLRQGALLNSAGLVALGITDKTPNPPGGKFEKDANGRLTGWLQGVSGWEFAYNKIPKLTLDKISQSLRNCFRELNRLGLTSVVDVQTSGVTFAHRRLLSEMARSRALTLRLNYYIALNPTGDELEQVRLASEEIKNLISNDLFRFGGFAGTLVPGVGDGDGLANPDGITIDAGARETFRALLHNFAETGINFQLQASQDNTARQLLDVIEQVHKETPFTRQRMIFAPMEDADCGNHRAYQETGRRHRRARRTGADRGTQRGNLGRNESAQRAAAAHDDSIRRANRRRHRCLPLVKLLADAFALVAGHRQDGGGHGTARSATERYACGSAAHVHHRQRLAALRRKAQRLY